MKIAFDVQVYAGSATGQVNAVSSPMTAKIVPIAADSTARPPGSRRAQSVGQARLYNSVTKPAVPQGRPMASASVNEVEPFMPDIEAQVTGLSAMTSICLKEFAGEVVRGNSAT